MITCLMNSIAWNHWGGPVECLDLFAACWLAKDNKLLGMTNSLCVVVTPKLELKISFIWIDAQGCKFVDVVERKICLSNAEWNLDWVVF